MRAFKATKKPVTIDAILWDGGNAISVYDFTNDSAGINSGGDLSITTMEGEMIANIGDYIIKGINGEFYPCKPDIFKLTYDFQEGGK